jgi:Protein of unknown function (DUF3467)
MNTPVISLATLAAAAMPNITKSASHKNIYSNTVRAGLGPWDIRIIFGEVIENADQSQSIEDHVTVVMSPLQAKAVLRVLETTIKSYESVFGEIPDLTPMLEKAKADAIAAASKAKN